MTKTDSQLKKDIENGLRWDPKVDAAQVRVSVDNGVVSLFGAVDTDAEKLEVEAAIRRVSGIRTVARDLVAKILPEHVHTDSDIAADSQSALQFNVYIPKTATNQVQKGSARLEGQVTWNCQHITEECEVRYPSGVVEVHNLITVKPQSSRGQVNGKVTHFWSRWVSYLQTQTSAKQIKEDVLAALQRQAATDAASIHVDTQNTKVTLTGHASSWQSIVDAANAASAAPGVSHVIDRVKLSR